MFCFIKEQNIERLISAVLISLSYILILYCGEARGYAGLVFFSLLSWFVLEKILSSKAEAFLYFHALSFLIVVMLGFLSHLLFINTFLSLCAYAVVRFMRSERSKLHLVILLAVPCLVIAPYLLIFFKNTAILSGPKQSMFDVILSSMTVAVGGAPLSVFNPTLTLFLLGFATYAIALSIVELYTLWKEGRKEWFFFSCVIFLVPSIMLLLHRPAVLFERYFIVSMVFFYILIASRLARMAKQGGVNLAITVVFLILFAVTNLTQSYRLTQYGRGEYQRLANYLKNQPLFDKEALSSHLSTDHPFRTSEVLSYYLKEEINISSNPLEFHLTHSQDRYYRPERAISLANKNYKLVDEYKSGSLSGWNWYLYKASS